MEISSLVGAVSEKNSAPAPDFKNSINWFLWKFSSWKVGGIWGLRQWISVQILKTVGWTSVTQYGIEIHVMVQGFHQILYITPWNFFRLSIAIYCTDYKSFCIILYTHDILFVLSS